MMNMPDKLIFKRSEVIKITRLDGKVIDYWQREFGGFSPTTNQLGELFYSKNDVELILKIKQWMVEEKIEKSQVKEMLKGQVEVEMPEKELYENDIEENFKKISAENLKIIRKNLQDILTILDKNGKNYAKE